MNYNSSNGFVTSVWGPALWFSMHVMSFNYRKDRAKKYADFFDKLTGVLPCGKCRDNLPSNIKSAQNEDGEKWWPSYPYFNPSSPPRAFKNRESFSRFVYDLHNVVNVMTGKPEHAKSYEDVRDEYERYRASGCMKPAEDEAEEGGCVKPADGQSPLKCKLTFEERDPVEQSIRMSMPDFPVHISPRPVKVVRVSDDELGIHLRRRGDRIVVTKSHMGMGIREGDELVTIDGDDATWSGLHDAIRACRSGESHDFGFM